MKELKSRSVSKNNSFKEDTSSLETINNPGERSDWRVEVEELWNIGKQLGLVNDGNAVEIIRRLGRRQRILWNVWFLGKTAIPYFFVNVYSPCDKQGKRALWEKLTELIREQGGGNWCIGGDFNAIRSKEEKRGRHFDCAEIREFNNFILDAELEDIPLLGRNFTCFCVDGWNNFKMKEKLKMLKNELKAWNKLVFGSIEKKLEDVKAEIRSLDEKGEDNSLTEVEIERRRICFHNFMEWSKARDKMLFQKSREKWLKEGDANTKYFHGCIIKRRKQCGIEGIMKDGEWFEEPEEVKQTIHDYFRGKFKEEKWNRPSIGTIPVKKISEEDNKMLVSTFTEEEIKEAVWSCDGNKSPGPDGFNFNLIKKVWPIIKEDICASIAEFYESGKMVKEGNASFIALIPKKENSTELGDYRPISVIGCMYKIVSNLLANRLRKVMDFIISQN
ncbi:hypothetical protein SLEP1_g26989 [Rubroshorea leprosula]|uniref:Uncharacterized protein n=1 Tax=Rubroshorea leprosula TaxID=152421 RepID=A0AAV5JZM7_9ROSI|nr:hypothetical protein SLEP1_g26989 [Rubroshorea leprosula]